MNFEELKFAYERADSYLDCALDFENHVKRDWIDTRVLGRWFLEGVRQETNAFSKKAGEFIDSNVNSGNECLDEVIGMINDVYAKRSEFEDSLNDKYDVRLG
ncbi:MAG: hypothetical protein ACOCUT_04435 [bacterium]